MICRPLFFTAKYKEKEFFFKNLYRINTLKKYIFIIFSKNKGLLTIIKGLLTIAIRLSFTYNQVINKRI